MKKLLFWLCSVACLSACAISARVPYQVNSTPPGAQLYVNGVSMGIAPIQIELACDKLWVCPASATCHWEFDDYAYEVTAYTTKDNPGLSQTKHINPCQPEARAGQIYFDLGSEPKEEKIVKDPAEKVKDPRTVSVRPNLGRIN